mgnify:CR=1 FL=1
MANIKMKQVVTPDWATTLLAAQVTARNLAGFETTDGIINAEGRKADVMNFHTKDFKSLNGLTIPSIVKLPEEEDGSLIPIVDNTYKQQIVLINDNQSPVIQIVFQTIPLQIRADQNTQWNQVRGIGMNNPFQIYTGSEDTINFEVSWYCTRDEDRTDVINKCKLLESWSKANGYLASPPILKLVWGDSDLYSNDLFILSAAPYQLSNFQKFAKKGDTVLNLGLYPNTAVQQITLKRVSLTNQKYEDLYNESDIKKTPGIRFY